MHISLANRSAALFAPQLEYDEILVLDDAADERGDPEKTGLILLGSGGYLSSRFPEEFGYQGSV